MAPLIKTATISETVFVNNNISLLNINKYLLINDKLCAKLLLNQNREVV